MHDELVDLVDRTGRIAHRGVWRSYVKKNRAELTASGLYLPIAIVVVLDERGRIVAQERGKRKSDGGCIDHVCGGQMSGEDILTTAQREAAQEVSVRLHSMRIVDAGVNAYGRYRTLLAARTKSHPRIGDYYEVERIVCESPAALANAHHLGTYRFVKGFFEDMQTALSA